MNYATTPGTIHRAAVEIICRNMGLPSATVSYPTQGKAPLPDNLTFRDIAILCVDAASSREQAGWSDRQDVVARALSTSDFANILADIANKSLLAAHAARPASFTKWASKGSLPNFKPADVCRVSAPGMLHEMRENDEYKNLTLEDGAERVFLRTFGGLLPISRHTIINDDLDALKDLSNLLAQSASLTQAAIATGALISNPKLSDDKEVFHADRKNLLTGSTSALSADSLAAAIAAMRGFANANGQPLLIEPKYLVVGPGNERLAYQLAFSDSDPHGGQQRRPELLQTDRRATCC